MAEFYEAPNELIDMAHNLIEEYHGHLIEARIKYLMRDGVWNTQKRETWGSAKKVGKEVKYLTDYDFIITIHKDVWSQLTIKERKALLDHELQHCFAGTDDEGNKVWGTQGHDVEDFYSVIRRNGLWSKQLKKLEETLNQIEFNFETSNDEQPSDELTALTGEAHLQLVSSSPRQLPAPDADADNADNADETQVDSDPEIIDAEIVDEPNFKNAAGT